jgi:hypothetical protein
MWLLLTAVRIDTKQEIYTMPLKWHATYLVRANVPLPNTKRNTPKSSAVQVAFDKSKGLAKPVFHFIASRVESPNQGLASYGS